LFFIAVIFMRNQIRPIRRLAEVAEKFGKGQDTQDFRPEGAFEVRVAGQAFNQMQKRLRTHIEERTRMLAGVSHDLRTPLTRMKLQLALMSQDNNVKNLQEDVDEMQQMVQGFLDFAKGIQNEKSTTIELNTTVEGIINGFKEAHPMSISFIHKKDLWIDIKKSIFNRCLTNLLLNSYKYASTVQIQILAEPHQAIIIIDDDGPGIPEEKREIVFQPFFRLDPARNSETGGVGLGLSIVRDAIHHHGGTIQLLQSPLGGLRIYITLPR
jgi:two-component system osmolarity sensor histidine kinase EnvZ